jgi:hypothetical protein
MTRLVTAFRNGVPRLTAGLAALALAGVFSTAAVASDAAYTVNVTVVKTTVPKSNPFKVIVKGVSTNTSQLVVYLNRTHKCAKTAAADSTLPKVAEIINKHVVGSYTKTRTEVAQFLGQHYACAYLRSTPPPTPVLLRARASASYTVISPTG